MKPQLVICHSCEARNWSGARRIVRTPEQLAGFMASHEECRRLGWDVGNGGHRETLAEV